MPSTSTITRRPRATRSPRASPSPATTFGAPAPSSIQGCVAPTYIRVLPVTDGWQSYFLYGNGNSTRHYGIESNGKNGSTDALVGGETTDFNEDIVFANGQFLQYPAGAQR